jgi:hypothetical protein
VQGAISTILCNYNLNGWTFHVIKYTNAICFTLSNYKTTASHAQNHDKQNKQVILPQNALTNMIQKKTTNKILRHKKQNVSTPNQCS